MLMLPGHETAFAGFPAFAGITHGSRQASGSGVAISALIIASSPVFVLPWSQGCSSMSGA